MNDETDLACKTHSNINVRILQDFSHLSYVFLMKEVPWVRFNLGAIHQRLRFRPAVEPLGYHCQALTGRCPEPSGLRSGSPRVFSLGRAAEESQMPQN